MVEYDDVADEQLKPLAHFEAVKGENLWLIGKILNKLKPIEKGKKGLLNKGGLPKLLKKLGRSKSWGENARKFSIVFNSGKQPEIVC